MEQPKEYFKSEGIILRVDMNNKNGTKLWFYFTENGKEEKYTFWSDTIVNNFKEGDEVIVRYSIQDNPYNGKVYHNRVISNIEFKNKGDTQLTTENYELLEKIGYSPKNKPLAAHLIKSENGVLKMGGLNYRIKEIEVELIKNGEDSL